MAASGWLVRGAAPPHDVTPLFLDLYGQARRGRSRRGSPRGRRAPGV